MDKSLLHTIGIIATVIAVAWMVRGDIAENTAAVERNTAAVAALDARMDGLESRMDGLDERLSVLETRLAELYGLLWAHIGGHRHTNQVADASEGGELY